MKNRFINTKFWSDSWVKEKLNPLDRYLVLYFLTNEHTNIAGIYELPLSVMAFETGLDKEDLEKSYLPRLEPRFIYFKGWVIISNFLKHQNIQSPDIIKGIKRELSEAPKEIIEKAKENGYLGGRVYRGSIDRVGYLTKPILNLTYTKPNSKERRKKFTSPSLEEIKNYCEERKNKIDPEGFLNFYASKGWFVGKNKMKDWKAAIRTWEQRDKPKSGQHIQI